MMDMLWIILILLLCIHPSTTQNERVERRFACWGSFGPPVVSAQCPRDTTIHVLKAGLKVANHVGRCEYNEADCGCLYGEAGCNMPDVRDLCMGRPACRLDVTQQYITTDKCRGFTDYMYIEFKCIPVEKTSIESVCSNTESDTEFGYIRGPGSLSADGITQCDCTLTTSPYSEMTVTLLDYHSGGYSCTQEKLVVQYGRNAQQFCSDRYEGGQTITSGGNKVSLTFSTEGRDDAGRFWLKYEAQPAAAIKIQCAYTIEPRAEKKTRKPPPPIEISLPENPSPPLSLNTVEPKLVVDSDPDPTSGYDEVTTGENVALEKMNDDSTKSTPWWWKFTLKKKRRGKNPDTVTTAFPPWFKEVDATEFPEWIRKTVTPADKTKVVKRIRVPAHKRPQQRQRLLESHKMIGRESSREKGAGTRDLVHGDQALSGQHQRHTELPQQNLPSKYHAARQPAHETESLASRSRAAGELAKLPGLSYSSENSIMKESPTATVIAACVIGSILLIVIIGIVVRFVINRADPNHSIRQHHKKECIVRRNQRERGKSYA